MRPGGEGPGATGQASAPRTRAIILRMRLGDTGWLVPSRWANNCTRSSSIAKPMWFHRASRADEWLLYDMESPSASHSLGLSMGRLFQNGQITANCAQEGLIRVVADRPPLS